MGIKLREHLINFKKLTYVKEEEKNFGDYVDCALGTNPFGYPTTVNQIMDKFDFSLINKYPDYPYKELKKALIRYWSEVADLKDTNFKIGNGSMDLIERINKMFIDKNSKVLGYCPQFPDYVGDVLCCNGIYEYVYLKMENNYKFTENDLETTWRNSIIDQTKFKIIDSNKILQIIDNIPDYSKLTDYLKSRYLD